MEFLLKEDLQKSNVELNNGPYETEEEAEKQAIELAAQKAEEDKLADRAGEVVETLILDANGRKIDLEIGKETKLEVEDKPDAV
jgi:hypothetical protein